MSLFLYMSVDTHTIWLLSTRLILTCRLYENSRAHSWSWPVFRIHLYKSRAILVQDLSSLAKRAPVAFLMMALERVTLTHIGDLFAPSIMLHDIREVKA